MNIDSAARRVFNSHKTTFDENHAVLNFDACNTLKLG